jgi:hypothetical protein
MTKVKFAITDLLKDTEMVELADKTDQKILAIWAIDCAERVIPFFEKKYPNDPRPRHAIDTLKEWLKTGIFKMTVIRGASLSSHKAAKEIGNDSSAASAAHAAGQTVATAHVPRHSLGSAIYAQQAIFRNSQESEALENVKKERDWQYHHLQELKSKIV